MPVCRQGSVARVKLGMATMRVQQQGKKREPDLSHRTFDILGIVLLALVVITFASLALSGTGVLGGAINGLFRALFGRGREHDRRFVGAGPFGLDEDRNKDESPPAHDRALPHPCERHTKILFRRATMKLAVTTSLQAAKE